MIRDLDERIERGIALLTAHLNRDPASGALDEVSFRAVLGQNITDDDVIAGLSDMLIVAEMVMLTYQVKTDLRPIEVLREVALYRQGPRDGECGQ